MGVFRGTKADEEVYRLNPALSQSKIKLLLNSVQLFNAVDEDDDDENYYTEKVHFIIGSAVDTIITMGKEECKKAYYISMIENKPSPTIMSVVKRVYDEWILQMSLTEEDFTSEGMINPIINICEEEGYQKNWKPETKYKKIIKEGQEYWNDLIKSNGRQVLSFEQFELIKTIYTSILGHRYTKDYFEEKTYENHYYQLPIYFQFNDVDCKALLDFVIVNHMDKTIQPIDIKTMGDYTINFTSSVFRRRYDIQAAFYTDAFWCSTWIVDNGLDGYKILPFKFIVESTINPGNPLVYECNSSLLDRGRIGIEGQWLGNQYIRGVDGFEKGIELYKWYMENSFEEEKIVAQTNGNLLLGLEGIIGK